MGTAIQTCCFCGTPRASRDNPAPTCEQIIFSDQSALSNCSDNHQILARWSRCRSHETPLGHFDCVGSFATRVRPSGSRSLPRPRRDYWNISWLPRCKYYQHQPAAHWNEFYRHDRRDESMVTRSPTRRLHTCRTRWRWGRRVSQGGYNVGPI